MNTDTTQPIETIIKRCPKGTRKNVKTGLCEKIRLIVEPIPPVIIQPKYVKINKTKRNLPKIGQVLEMQSISPPIGEQVGPEVVQQVSPQLNKEIAKPSLLQSFSSMIGLTPQVSQPVTEEVIKPVTEEVIKPVTEEVIKPVTEEVIKPPIEEVIKHRCKNGTRRDKKGNCIPNNATIAQKPHITIEPGQTDELPLATSRVNVDELPSNGLPSNGLPSNGLPSNGLPSNGLPSNGLPSNGLPKELNIQPHPVENAINASTTVSPPSLPIVQDKDITDDINLEDKLGKLELDSNEYIREKERIEFQYNETNQEYDFLYPDINDPNFNIKIAKRKEFNDTQYDGSIQNIKEYANLMCKAEFELMPHQLFVKNFLSFQTPYNSLLLYHGLGSGKTCSAIGVAEEMRNYMKSMGIKQRIIVIASPNVQDNFKLQLFDETKLKLDGELWTIKSCIGNSLLKEVNPTNIGGLTKEKIISNIKSIINNNYVFMGYVEFANYISKKTSVSIESGYSEQDRRNMKIKNIKKVFNSRLIIIDEVHNIRITDDNKNKRIGLQLFELAKYSDNLRFLFLSATPMYNTYKEIVWLTNLMNLNDGRGQIEIGEIFDKDGLFKEPETLKNGLIVEGGKAILQRKLIGYVSYIRGENPYTFPYRIYPNIFAQGHTFGDAQEAVQSTVEAVQSTVEAVQSTVEAVQSQEPIRYPTVQLNTKPIDEPLKYINVYVSPIGEFQEAGYSYIINQMKNKMQSYSGESTMPNFENMDSFGYTMLMEPLEALNIIYPGSSLDNIIESRGEIAGNPQDSIIQMIGKQGLANIMNSVDDSSKKPPQRYNFDYKKPILEKYGRIFHQDHIHKYSNKIASICDTIRHSKGIIIIYSQYIDGGIVPIALALEEMGFLRYGSASHTKSLFKKPPTELLDAVTLKPKGQVAPKDFKQAKYMMITGDKAFSPNNSQDIKFATDPDNKYGYQVKVILISKAGSEGLDFKNIRQVHIMEPWYNMNRIEQIIGRGVRNLSHCLLPFEQRNVELYLHSTIMPNKPAEECADLYVYRLAEKKAIQIGQVTRLLKENSVDCLLNIGQSNFTIAKLNEIAENQNIMIELSSGNTIQYKIGDRKNTDICDYMDNCEYTCSPTTAIGEADIVKSTYNNDFVSMNNGRIKERIRALFKDKSYYKREELINAINIVKQYPVEQIYSALTSFVKNKNELVIDKYGRHGNLIDKIDKSDNAYYVFQPSEITDENASIYDRSIPVEFKHSHLLLETVSELPLPGKPVELMKEVIDNIGVLQSEYLKILEEFDKNMQNIYTQNQIPLAEREWDYYIHGRRIRDHIHKVYGISEEILQKYFIYHMLDTLLFNDKMVFIQIMYSGSWTPLSKKSEIQNMEGIIKAYFDRCIMRTPRKTGVLFNKDASWKIWVQSNENPTVWIEGQPEDTNIFSAEILKKIVPVKRLADRVGFMSLFKNTEMVFYVKDMTKKRNIGAKADSAGKVRLIELINHIHGQNIYNHENTKTISQVGLCIILEFLMRYKTEFASNGGDNTVYYLLPEQAAIIKVKEI